jgi:hypothetical protein
LRALAAQRTSRCSPVSWVQLAVTPPRRKV